MSQFADADLTKKASKPKKFVAIHFETLHRPLLGELWRHWPDDFLTACHAFNKVKGFNHRKQLQSTPESATSQVSHTSLGGASDSECVDFDDTVKKKDANATLAAWRQHYILRLVDAHYTNLTGEHDVEQVLHLLNRFGALYKAAAEFAPIDTLI